MKRRYNRHNRHGDLRPHTSPGLPRVHLEVVRGHARYRIRPVTVPTFLVGTAPDCDLVLGDPQFADVHCYLLRSRRGVSLRHLGQAPEMTVNGKPVTSAPLSDGDRIRTGPYEFRLLVEWPRSDRKDPIQQHATDQRDTDPHDAGPHGPTPLAHAQSDRLLCDIRRLRRSRSARLRVHPASGATPGQFQTAVPNTL